ncbi:MAG: hypothetical protein RMJ82_15745, partial [Gemmatales bacterium]|nr:hypothetical protein [Gemmatales bacterium]
NRLMPSDSFGLEPKAAMPVKLKPPKNGTEEAGRPPAGGFLRSGRAEGLGNTDFWRNDLLP